ncbi:hypothetical protein HYDPIDRAFT_114246 [Hydnomerulius pinastri MD-312]|uniref:Uncharacterized protein n=1 Tax=Hydnomerulius pinastri MD-312 TaxID=994086 RepID=A0A0C9VA82_9AGAM|nr:hypothetical protein HYDPIDRAFT_114246 [Hydnomerulius pinastri MD-312]
MGKSGTLPHHGTLPVGLTCHGTTAESAKGLLAAQSQTTSGLRDNLNAQTRKRASSGNPCPWESIGRAKVGEY